MTTSPESCLCTTSLVLGGLALADLALIIWLVAVGLRALVGRRDVVWECRWQLPGRIGRRLQALRQWQPRLSGSLTSSGSSGRSPARSGAASASLRTWVDQAVHSASLRAAGSSASRRPVRSHHYLTVGERMRMRAEPRRWAA